ncbi:MAG: SemiSWEET family transporter [Candidatus Micrarchaeaceae archaeon]|jgi:MtN3 and saliva related transmembrane protein
MDIVPILGLLASIIVTIAYIPQVMHTVKTKHTRGISKHWLIILDSGLILYTVYGILVSSIPIIISSGFGAIMISILLAYKIKYK